MPRRRDDDDDFEGSGGGGSGAGDEDEEEEEAEEGTGLLSWLMGEPPTEDVMTFKGKKEGAYIQETKYRFVGSGMGEFDVVNVATPTGGTGCCCFCVSFTAFVMMLVLALLVVYYGLFEWTSTTTTVMTTTTRVGFDCRAASWEKAELSWSDVKKAFCCQHLGVGCPRQDAPCQPSSPYNVPGACQYDCDAALDSWVGSWSVPKKAWCCKNRGKGCSNVKPVPAVKAAFDCQVGFANGEWLHGWSDQKKVYCCKHSHRGCPVEPPTTTPCPFDCGVGYTNWQRGWSDKKKTYCCSHEGKGCPDSILA